MSSVQYEVNPLLYDYLNKPLWCVYGHDCFPTIIACMINDISGCGPTIWGYSVYKRKPGYRTLGISLKSWYEQHNTVKFFDNQAVAMDYLNKLITPKCLPPSRY